MRSSCADRRDDEVVRRVENRKPPLRFDVWKSHRACFTGTKRECKGGLTRQRANRQESSGVMKLCNSILESVSLVRNERDEAHKITAQRDGEEGYKQATQKYNECGVGLQTWGSSRHGTRARTCRYTQRQRCPRKRVEQCPRRTGETESTRSNGAGGITTGLA